MIVKKFRPFIKKGGVILVAFNHEGFAFPKSKAARKVMRNSSDDKTRVFAKFIEDVSHK